MNTPDAAVLQQEKLSSAQRSNRVLRSVAAGQVALTFDDGPDPDYTPRILDVLAAAQVRATFFVIGVQALRHPRLIRRIVTEGHSLASHGWSHKHPWLMGAVEARREVALAAESLSSLADGPVQWYRPPHGRLRACMLDEAGRHQQSVALWSRSAVDWGLLGTAERVARRLDRVKGGDVLLMHDGRNRHNRPAATLQALPRLLAVLAERGLAPVTLA